MATIQLGLPALRAQRGLSQRQLAAQAGVRQDTISALERGVSHGIQFDTLARLCAALRCAPGEILLFGEPEDRPDEEELVAQRLAELEQAPAIDGPAFLAALLERAGMDPEMAARIPPGAAVPPDADEGDPKARGRAPIDAVLGESRA